jgi:hypothetical protein
MLQFTKTRIQPTQSARTQDLTRISEGGPLWLRLAYSRLFVFVDDDVVLGVGGKFSPLVRLPHLHMGRPVKPP